MNSHHSKIDGKITEIFNLFGMSDKELELTKQKVILACSLSAISELLSGDPVLSKRIETVSKSNKHDISLFLGDKIINKQHQNIYTKRLNYYLDEYVKGLTERLNQTQKLAVLAIWNS